VMQVRGSCCLVVLSFVTMQQRVEPHYHAVSDLADSW
jgi:hypothetical protein